MKKSSFVFLSLFVLLVFAGCSTSEKSAPSFGTYDSSSGKTESSESSQSSNTNMMSGSTGNTAQVSKGRNSGGGGGGGQLEAEPIAQKISLEQADKSQTAPVATERKIIRNAELTLETDSPDDSQSKINAIAESKGGFVIESQKQTSDTKATKIDVVTMTVRIPAAKFDESLNEIRQSANRVIIETVKGQDVTEEFIDIEARLKTQKALEVQFLEIMKQAKSVEDALDVQSKIADVRGEIEKVEGRKRFLENQSEFSTLKIRLQSATAFSTSSSGFFYQFGQSVSRGFDAAMSFILALVTFLIALLPFLIFIVLPIYFVIRYFLRKNRKQKLAGEIAQEEIKNG